MLSMSDYRGSFFHGATLALLVFCGVTAVLGVCVAADTPTTAEDYSNVGMELLEQKDFKGAVEAFTQSIALNPNVGRVYYNLGIAQASLGLHNEAIASFKKAVELNQELLPKAYSHMAWDLEQTGQNDEAAAVMATVTEIDPINFPDPV